MLEDESGRLRLTGSLLRTTQLATGAIVAALGTENANGDFEVIDIKVPDLPRQPSRWERDESSPSDESKQVGKSPAKNTNTKIAFVSGLAITGSSSDTLTLDLLTDYLLGYTGSDSSSSISRLIIAGNSLGASITSSDPGASTTKEKKKPGPKKYGYDASSYNPSPITQFDSFLADILPSIPISLMPGETDPANFSLPQQGIHRAMLPRARAYCAAPGSGPDPGWLDSVTNPWEADVEGWRVWGSSGQNVDDVLRYLDFADDAPELTNGETTGDGDGDGDIEARVKIMEAMLRWRCGVPTAPDTLCKLLPSLLPIPQILITPTGSYPFQSHDPFILQSCPHIFFAGNQPRFKTALVEGDSPLKLNGADTDAEMTDIMNEEGSGGPRVRILAVPRFRDTGELVLVDCETLEVEVVRFGVFGREETK